MADSSNAVTPTPQEAPSKKGSSQLENLSQEDLVKQCRRQLMFLQKAKAKSDDLTKRVGVLEEENRKLLAVSDDAVKATNLCHELESKLKTVQEELLSEKESQKQAELREREHSEQLQCTNMKLSTLQQTCQFLQGEMQAIEERHKEARQQIEVLTEARDAALNSLKSMKENWNTERSSFEARLAELQSGQGSESFTVDPNKSNDSIQSFKEQSDKECLLLNEELAKEKEKTGYWESRFEELNFAFSSRKDEWYNERTLLDSQLVKTTEEKVLLELKIQDFTSEFRFKEQVWEEQKSSQEVAYAELQQQFSNITDENHRLGLSISEQTIALHTSKQQWNEERTSLDNRIDELESQLGVIKEETPGLDLERQIFQKEKSFLENQLVELENQLAKARIENDLLQLNLEKVKQVKDEHASIDNQLIQSESELTKIKQGNQILLHEMEECKQARLAVNEQLVFLENQLVKAKDERAFLESSVSELTASLNSCKQQYQSEQSILENQKIQLEQTINELNCSLESLQFEHSSLMVNSANEKALFESLQVRNKYLETMIEEINGNMATLSDAWEGEKLQLIAAHEDLSTTKDQLLRQSEEHVSRLAEENRCFEEKLIEMAAHSDSKVDNDAQTDDSKWAELRDKCEQLKLTVTSLQKEKADLESERNNLEVNYVDSSTQTEEDLSIEIAQKELEIQVLTADNEVLKRRLEELGCIEQNSNDNVHLELDYVKMAEQNKALQSLVESLKEDLVLANEKQAENFKEPDGEPKVKTEQDARDFNEETNVRSNYGDSSEDTSKTDTEDELNSQQNLLEELKAFRKEKILLEQKISSYENGKNLTIGSVEVQCCLEDTESIHVLKSQLSQALQGLQELTQELRVSQDHRDQVSAELQQVVELEKFLEEEVCSLREECNLLAQNVLRLEANAENDTLHVGQLEKELRAMEDKEVCIKRFLSQGQEEKCALEKELEVKLSELEALTQELTEAHKVSNIKVLEVAQLQTSLDAVENELAIIKDQLEKSNQLNISLEAKVHENVELDKQFSSASEELTEKRNLSIRLEEEIRVMTSHVELLEGELSHLRLASLDAEKRDSESVADLQKQLQLKEESIALLKTEAQNLNSVVSRLQEQLKESVYERDSVQQRINEFNAEITRKESEYTENMQSLKHSFQEQILTNRDAFENQIDIKEKVVQNLQKEIHDLKQIIPDLEKQLEGSAIRMEELSNEVTLKDTQIRIVEERSSKSEFLVLELQQQLKDSHQIVNDQSCEQTIESNNNVEDVIETQETESFQQNINNPTPEIEHWKAVVEDLKENIKKSIEDKESFEKELNEKNERIVVLEEQLKDLGNNAAELEERLRLAPEVPSPEQVRQESGNQLRMDKLKVVAIKLKKELSETKRELLELKVERETMLTQREELSASSRQHLKNFQSLQSENDRLQDEHESQRKKFTQMESDVTRLVSELSVCKEQLAEGKQETSQLKGALDAAEQEKKRLEAARMELQSQLIVARSERDMEMKKSEGIRVDVKQWETKCQSLEKDLKQKDQQAKDLQARLDQLRLELEQGRVLSLELGDYERSMGDMNAQLAQKALLVEELTTQISERDHEHEGLRREIGHLEHQCLSQEGRSAHLKDSLDVTRAQLAAKVQAEAELVSSLADVEKQKEEVVFAKEELQCQLSEAAGRLSKLERDLRLNREHSEKLSVNLKARISSLEMELASVHQQLDASKDEFNNYKVRVHSVLKQQKSSGIVSASSSSAIEQEQREQLERALDLCKGKMAQMSDELSTLALERDSLAREKELLTNQKAALIQQIQDKEEVWVFRLEELNQGFNLSRSLWDSERQQLLQQQHQMLQEHNDRMSAKEEGHEKEMSSLESQLERLQKNAVHSNVQQSSDHSNQPQRQSSLPPTFDWSPTSLRGPATDEAFDILSQERQEGEGSESTDVSQNVSFKSLMTVPAAGFMPLDRLLQSEPNPAAWSQDPELLISNIGTLQKKVDHLAELLNESEASNLRLSEQTRVLKEEIRRLERNKARQEQEANLEYLKNVLLKFSTLPPSSERERLVPVLSTLLKLSPEEQAKMMAVAGHDDPNAQGASGWGGYLHRWSGLV